MYISNLFSLVKFNQITLLKKQTKEFLSLKMKSDKFLKKEILYKVGDTCDQLFLIKKGLIRSYYEVNGQEITTWVSHDDYIFTSIPGYFSQQVCKENIQCLEDTYVEYLYYEDMEEALERFPDFAILNRRLMEEYYYAAEIRSIIPRIPGGRERLAYFMKHYDLQIIERTPNKILASLLNMRPETLSRLIKEL